MTRVEQDGEKERKKVGFVELFCDEMMHYESYKLFIGTICIYVYIYWLVYTLVLYLYAIWFIPKA